MTGGQPVDGELTVPRCCASCRPKAWAASCWSPTAATALAGGRHPPRRPIRHRDELDVIQRELRTLPGVSVIVFDQTCAAEKRRRRKRGTYPDPQTRVFINEAVCEGCGDCGRESNCMAILPVETEFGRKRQIDQSACNKDYSCMNGFCPSFVTVEGGRLRHGRAQAGEQRGPLPRPLPATGSRGASSSPASAAPAWSPSAR
jgi:indolepyruvate ferredoxin oxidoreductase